VLLCVKKSFRKKFYKTNTRFEFLDLDYPLLKVYEKYFPLFSPYSSANSEVRTHKQASEQSDNFFSMTLLYEKENIKFITQ
jgi:hypothetical protein